MLIDDNIPVPAVRNLGSKLLLMTTGSGGEFKRSRQRTVVPMGSSYLGLEPTAKSGISRQTRVQLNKIHSMSNAKQIVETLTQREKFNRNSK